MKKFFSIFLFFAMTLPLLASSGIKGTIVDAQDQSTLDFVNVALFKKGLKTPVVGVTTDNNGTFNIPSVDNGNYLLRISYVGFSTVSLPVTVAGKSVDLGTIKLVDDSKTLAEVEVVGQASNMHFEVDKKVFNVDQNISAAGGSASDVLKNIPSVTVDNQGNVALRNDGNVQVWINGKASGLTADNRAQVLQQMPAENIASIEIMDNPSAKYSPEGSAGIINIVMKENHKAGYYGSVSGGLTYPDGGKIGQNLGASINYSSSKVDAYMNLGYRAMSFQGGGTTNRKNYIGNDTTLLTQTNKMITAFSGLFLRAGIDYHLTSKNTLSFSGFGMAGTGTQNTSINYLLTNDMLNSTNPLRNYSQINAGTGDRPSYNIDLSFKHDFNKKGSSIIADVNYSSHKRDGNGTYVQNDILNHKDTISNLSQGTVSNNRQLEFKLDYTNKLTQDSKLEAGWQSDFGNRLSGTTGFDNLHNLDIPSYYDSFNYNEQIHAGYVTYGNKFGKLNFQLGLRGELLLKQYSDTTEVGTTKVVEVSEQKHFFHIFPSLFLSYSLPNNGELQFNYSNRVNRPRGQQINPFRNYSDSTNITYGNPNLAPQYSTALELNYIKTWGAQTLSTSIYTHFTDNVVQSVHFLQNGVMQSTYLNVSKSQNTGLELISKNRVLRFMDLTTTLNLYYSKLDSSTYVNPYNSSVIIPISGQTNFSWTANVMANFMLSKTFSGQITAEYASPQLIAQGTANATYSIDFGVRKSLLDRKLNVSLNVRDLLNSDRNYQTTAGTGFSQTTSSYFHGRMIGLTVSYSFGNMKPKQAVMKKQTAAPDMMDNGD